MRVSRHCLAEWESAAGVDGLSSLAPGRDYEGLNKQGMQLRVRLPEQAKLVLEQVAKMEGFR